MRSNQSDLWCRGPRREEKNKKRGRLQRSQNRSGRDSPHKQLRSHFHNFLLTRSAPPTGHGKIKIKNQVYIQGQQQAEQKHVVFPPGLIPGSLDFQQEEAICTGSFERVGSKVQGRQKPRLPRSSSSLHLEPFVVLCGSCFVLRGTPWTILLELVQVCHTGESLLTNQEAGSLAPPTPGSRRCGQNL